MLTRCAQHQHPGTIWSTLSEDERRGLIAAPEHGIPPEGVGEFVHMESFQGSPNARHLDESQVVLERKELGLGAEMFTRVFEAVGLEPTGEV